MGTISRVPTDSRSVTLGFPEHSRSSKASTLRLRPHSQNTNENPKSRRLSCSDAGEGRELAEPAVLTWFFSLAYHDLECDVEGFTDRGDASTDVLRPLSEFQHVMYCRWTPGPSPRNSPTHSNAAKGPLLASALATAAKSALRRSLSLSLSLSLGQRTHTDFSLCVHQHHIRALRPDT